MSPKKLQCGLTKHILERTIGTNAPIDAKASLQVIIIVATKDGKKIHQFFHIYDQDGLDHFLHLKLYLEVSLHTHGFNKYLKKKCIL